MSTEPQTSPQGGGGDPPRRIRTAVGLSDEEPPRGNRPVRLPHPDGRVVACLWGTVLALGPGIYTLRHEPSTLIGSLLGLLLAKGTRHWPRTRNPREGWLFVGAMAGALVGHSIGLVMGWPVSHSIAEAVLYSALGMAAALGGMAAVYAGAVLARDWRARLRPRL